VADGTVHRLLGDESTGFYFISDLQDSAAVPSEGVTAACEGPCDAMLRSPTHADASTV
jgi:hypothetical protein